jgi:RHH-type rel operon transcriptional repressor/antitoxin RelB
MTISLRLDDDDATLFKNFTEKYGLKVFGLVRQSVLRRIKDEYDIKAYGKAMATYRPNPATHSLDEVERDLDLR